MTELEKKIKNQEMEINRLRYVVKELIDIMRRKDPVLLFNQSDLEILYKLETVVDLD